MVIPNVEIKSIYKNTIRSWFIDHINRDSRTDILESVIHADAEKLEDLLCTWLTNTISCFDEQENYYHGFVTGLVSGFQPGFHCCSGRKMPVSGHSVRGRPGLFPLLCRVLHDFRP